MADPFCRHPLSLPVAAAAALGRLSQVRCRLERDSLTPNRAAIHRGWAQTAQIYDLPPVNLQFPIRPKSKELPAQVIPNSRDDLYAGFLKIGR
ncbi:MAG TPA: hypothetical protein VMI06_14795 [Terriglobia bacterium]|nr:hypothetical protein [Terriglobia bacterium]